MSHIESASVFPTDCQAAAGHCCRSLPALGSSEPSLRSQQDLEPGLNKTVGNRPSSLVKSVCRSIFEHQISFSLFLPEESELKAPMVLCQ